MLNQFSADWYRLRKSASFRNTLIGLAVMIIFIAGVMRFTEPLLAADIKGLDWKINGQTMTNLDASELEDALAELGELVPSNATEFTAELLGSNAIPFFLLPFIVTIFTADYSFMTYRNTLSYETNRRKIYMSKLALSAVGCLILVVSQLLLSWLIGGIAFGFSGLSGEYLVQIIVASLLLLPSQLALMCFGHCIAAFTKKTSSTLMVFIVTLMAASLLIEFLSMSSRFSWLQLFNWNSMGKQLINYPQMQLKDILIMVTGGVVIAIATTLAGISRYQKTDMA